MPEYNKLVRDKIPEIIEAHGEKAITRILSDEEYLRALITKIIEEQKELSDAKTVSEQIAELADLQEIILAIAQHIASTQELTTVRIDKARKRGGFNKRIFLERTE